jgi:transporter family-2 protein
MCLPHPLPTAESLAAMPWWAPLGGVIGAFAVIAGLLFVGKVGAGIFAGLTITANILMSLAIDRFGMFGMRFMNSIRAVSEVPRSWSPASP